MKKTLYFAIPAIAGILSWFRVIPPIIAILIMISVLAKFIAEWRLERDRAAKLKRLEEEFKEPRVFTFPHVPDIVLLNPGQAPPRTYAGMFWVDESGTLKIRNSQNDAWISVGLESNEEESDLTPDNENISASGCTSRDEALRIGRHILRRDINPATFDFRGAYENPSLSEEAQRLNDAIATRLEYPLKKRLKYNKATCKYFNNNPYLPCAVNCATGCDECKDFEERL